jgi:hypothetical protein
MRSQLLEGVYTAAAAAAHVAAAERVSARQGVAFLVNDVEVRGAPVAPQVVGRVARIRRRSALSSTEATRLRRGRRGSRGGADAAPPLRRVALG